MNNRIRYEDLNWRVVTNDENKHIWFERSNEDVMGVKIWEEVGVGTRRQLSGISDVNLLTILWALLDQYTIDQEQA